MIVGDSTVCQVCGKRGSALEMVFVTSESRWYCEGCVHGEDGYEDAEDVDGRDGMEDPELFDPRDVAILGGDPSL